MGIFVIPFYYFCIAVVDWEYATEDSLCLTHHLQRNSWNMLEVKGGLPSVLISYGAPYIDSCR